MRVLMAALAALLLAGGPGFAQAPPVSIFAGSLQSLGYCQITNLAASTTLVTASCSTGSVPESYTAIDMIVETTAIRYRTDGTDPTAALGMPIAANGEKVFVLSNFSKFHMIQQGAGAVVDIEFFK